MILPSEGVDYTLLTYQVQQMNAHPSLWGYTRCVYGVPYREGCVSRQLSLQGYTRCIYGVPYRDGCVCIALSVRAHTVHIILWRTLQGGLCVHSHPSL